MILGQKREARSARGLERNGIAGRPGRAWARGKFHEMIVRSGMVVEDDSEEEEEEEEEAMGREPRRRSKKTGARAARTGEARADPVECDREERAASHRGARRGPGGGGPGFRAASSPRRRLQQQGPLRVRERRGGRDCESSRRPARCCCLRARPKSWIRDEGATRLPLNLRVHAINAMSIEGDLIAVTGNAHPGDIMGRSEGEFAGFMRVPRPSLLATRVDGNWTYSPPR